MDKQVKVINKLQALWVLMPNETFGSLMDKTFGNRLAYMQDFEIIECLNRAIRDLLRSNNPPKKFEPKESEYVRDWKKHKADDYVNANDFLTKLKRYSTTLTRKDYGRIKGMALSGDIDGAMVTLAAMIKDDKGGE